MHLFYSLLKPHHATVSYPSPGDKPPERGREFRKNTGTNKKWPSETQSTTYEQGHSTHSFLSRIVVEVPSSSLPPTASFTPSIQPYHGLPRTCQPLTSSINTLQTTRYSSILSTCPNHSMINSTRELHFYSSSTTHLVIPDSVHSWHSHQTHSFFQDGCYLGMTKVNGLKEVCA